MDDTIKYIILPLIFTLIIFASYDYCSSYNESLIINNTANVSMGYDMREIMNNLNSNFLSKTSIIGDTVIGLYDLFSIMVFFVIALSIRVVDFELRIMAGSFICILIGLFFSLVLSSGLSMFMTGTFITLFLVFGVIYGYTRWAS